MRVISGIQSTGTIHIGNYLGALKNFSKFDQTNAMFFVADLHSITCGFSKNLARDVKFVFSTYLASGLDVKKSILFVQSHVPEVTELMWILSSVTPVGMLNRMTQYKSKSDKVGQLAGLYFYPILMAADILLYDGQVVPVGEDQIQHLELVQEIARKFNNAVNQEIFLIPEAKITQDSCRIMSLTNPLKKMSKSDEDDNSRINITDSNDVIKKKISRAMTDSDLIESADVMKKKNRYAPLNLLSIMAGISDKDLETVCNEYVGAQFSRLKSDLVDIIINEISPIREKITEYMQGDEINNMMKDGAERARFIALEKLQIIKKAINYYII